MDQDDNLTASHYFKANNPTIFDELSKGQNEKSASELDTTPLKTEEKNSSFGIHSSDAKMHPYFPGASAFAYIGSQADMPLIESVALDESVLANVPESVLSPKTMEIDHTYDAWIPCEATKEALAGLALAPDTFKVDKSQLIMPGIVLKEEFVSFTLGFLFT